MAIDAILLQPTDNVATAVQELKAGQKAAVRTGTELHYVMIEEPIPYGHKFSVRDILLGEHIIKYGEVIGQATANIKIGHHAHVQNIESLRGRGDLQGEV